MESEREIRESNRLVLLIHSLERIQYASTSCAVETAMIEFTGDLLQIKLRRVPTFIRCDETILVRKYKREIVACSDVSYRLMLTEIRHAKNELSLRGAIPILLRVMQICIVEVRAYRRSGRKRTTTPTL